MRDGQITKNGVTGAGERGDADNTDAEILILYRRSEAARLQLASVSDQVKLLRFASLDAEADEHERREVPVARAAAEQADAAVMQSASDTVRALALKILIAGRDGFQSDSLNAVLLAEVQRLGRPDDIAA